MHEGSNRAGALVSHGGQLPLIVPQQNRATGAGNQAGDQVQHLFFEGLTQGLVARGRQSAKQKEAGTGLQERLLPLGGGRLTEGFAIDQNGIANRNLVFRLKRAFAHPHAVDVGAGAAMAVHHAISVGTAAYHAVLGRHSAIGQPQVGGGGAPDGELALAQIEACSRFFPAYDDQLRVHQICTPDL